MLHGLCHLANTKGFYLKDYFWGKNVRLVSRVMILIHGNLFLAPAQVAGLPHESLWQMRLLSSNILPLSAFHHDTDNKEAGKVRVC